MKYKIGDKFLQEIKVGRIDEDSPCPYKMLPDGGAWSEAALDDLRRPDDMTVEEAWEIARKIVYLYFEDPGEEFSGTYTSSYDLLMKLSPQQAKAKIEAREAEKKAAGEIKAGDVVAYDDYQDIKRGVVTFINDADAYVMWFDGTTGKHNAQVLQKIGRHIDIQSVFEQIGGAENAR